MSVNPGTPVCVACSIFRAEIERLQAEGKLPIPVRFQSSMLHMLPYKLGERLQEVVKEEQAKGRVVVLAYGDCCPTMTDLESTRGVARTQGFNCPEPDLSASVS